MTSLPLSELIGSTVIDASGAPSGRVREVALAPQEDRDRISSFIVKTKSGNRLLPYSSVSRVDEQIHATSQVPTGLPPTAPKDSFCWNAICSINRLSMSTAAKSSA